MTTGFRRHEVCTVVIADGRPVSIFVEVDGGCAWIGGRVRDSTEGEVSHYLETEFDRLFYNPSDGSWKRRDIDPRQPDWPRFSNMDPWKVAADMILYLRLNPDRPRDPNLMETPNRENKTAIASALIDSVPLLEAAVIMES